MLVKIIQGKNFDPEQETQNENFVLLISFIYHAQKILMLVLSFLIVQSNQLDWATLIGVGLTAWDMIFFTNFTNANKADTISMVKLFLKQIAVIGICLLVATHGKEVKSRKPLIA